MIGNIIQYILYALLFVTVFSAIAGLAMTVMARKGYSVNLTTSVATLGIIAAAAPYIGLLGTVWHIIQALSGIAGGDLNVAAIAKPIGEALYATMWGLGCAIPALVVHRIIVILAPADEEAEPVTVAAAE